MNSFINFANTRLKCFPCFLGEVSWIQPESMVKVFAQKFDHSLKLNGLHLFTFHPVFNPSPPELSRKLFVLRTFCSTFKRRKWNLLCFSSFCQRLLMKRAQTPFSHSMCRLHNCLHVSVISDKHVLCFQG